MNILKKLKNFSLKKAIAIFTTICFVFSIVSSQVVYAAMPIPTGIHSQTNLNNIPNTLIPFNLGRITDAYYSNDNQDIVINIQDLHSHEQTQRNISSILSILDNKFGITDIYLEGASGTLNTQWLSNIKDDSVKQKVLNNLLENGRLTGGEYFAVQTGKNDILKGLEDRNIYSENTKRLNEIYNKRAEIQNYISVLTSVFNEKSKLYRSAENKKINRIVTSYRNGKIKTDKYITYLLKKAQKTDINLSKYKSIVSFAKILSKQKEFNSNKLNNEIKELLAELKEKLTFAEYSTLIENATKKEYEVEFYFNLLKKAKELNILSAKRYKNTEKFLEYLILNQNINTIELANDEKLFIQELKNTFASTQAEKDIYFIQDNLESLAHYLTNKMTAKEHEQFTANKNNFQLLWEKYIDIDNLTNLAQYLDLVDDFYGNNIERNRIFIKNIFGKKPNKAIDGLRIKNSKINHSEKILESLNKNKKVHVVITGGFHTYGFNKLLEDENINYIVITPNVTEETTKAEALYENIFNEQYDIANTTFANRPICDIIPLLQKGEIKDVKTVDSAVEIEYMSGEIVSLNKISREKTAPGTEILSEEQAELVVNIQELLKKIRESNRAGTAVDIFTDLDNLEQLNTKITNPQIQQFFTDQINKIRDDNPDMFEDMTGKMMLPSVRKILNVLFGFIKNKEIKNRLMSITAAVLETPLIPWILFSPETFVLMHYKKRTRQQIKTKLDDLEKLYRKRELRPNALDDTDLEKIRKTEHFLEKIGYTQRLKGTLEMRENGFVGIFLVGFSFFIYIAGAIEGTETFTEAFYAIINSIPYFFYAFVGALGLGTDISHIKYNLAIDSNRSKLKKSIIDLVRIFPNDVSYQNLQDLEKSNLYPVLSDILEIFEKDFFSRGYIETTGNIYGPLTVLEILKGISERGGEINPEEYDNNIETIIDYFEHMSEEQKEIIIDNIDATLYNRYLSKEERALLKQYRRNLINFKQNHWKLSTANSRSAESTKTYKVKLFPYEKPEFVEAVSLAQAFNDVIYRITNGNKLEMYIIRKNTGFYDYRDIVADRKAQKPKKERAKYEEEQFDIFYKRFVTEVPPTSYAKRTGKKLTVIKQQPEAGEYIFNIKVEGVNDIPELSDFQTVCARSPRQAVLVLARQLCMAAERGEIVDGKYEHLVFSKGNIKAIEEAILQKYNVQEHDENISRIVKGSNGENVKENVAPVLNTSAPKKQKGKRIKTEGEKYQVKIPDFNDKAGFETYQIVYATSKEDAVSQAFDQIRKAKESGYLIGGYYNYRAINEKNRQKIIGSILSKYKGDKINSIVILLEPAYEQLSLDSLVAEHEQEEPISNIPLFEPSVPVYEQLSLADLFPEQFGNIEGKMMLPSTRRFLNLLFGFIKNRGIKDRLMSIGAAIIENTFLFPWILFTPEKFAIWHFPSKIRQKIRYHLNNVDKLYEIKGILKDLDSLAEQGLENTQSYEDRLRNLSLELKTIGTDIKNIDTKEINDAIEESQNYLDNIGYTTILNGTINMRNSGFAGMFLVGIFLLLPSVVGTIETTATLTDSFSAILSSIQYFFYALIGAFGLGFYGSHISHNLRIDSKKAKARKELKKSIISLIDLFPNDISYQNIQDLEESNLYIVLADILKIFEEDFFNRGYITTIENIYEPLTILEVLKGIPERGQGINEEEYDYNIETIIDYFEHMSGEQKRTIVENIDATLSYNKSLSDNERDLLKAYKRNITNFKRKYWKLSIAEKFIPEEKEENTVKQEQSILQNLISQLGNSQNDIELKDAIELMIKAGFKEEYLESLLYQYLTLREGNIPQEIYTKTTPIKFGTAGVRGIMGEEVDFLDIVIITQAISNIIQVIASTQNIDTKNIKVFVGGDSRFLSKQFAEIVSKTLAANDIKVVISKDDIPSPTISYYTKTNGFTLSINITASHNPKEYNGYKITLGDGGQAGLDITTMIENEIQNIQNQIAANADPGIKIVNKEINSVDAKDDFIKSFIKMIRKIFAIDENSVLEKFKEKTKEWTIVVDPKNGATKNYYSEILKFFGFNVVMINDTFDPTFGGQKPEPSFENTEQLRTKVAGMSENKLLGISTDVDGDRFAVVDKNGNFITANKIGTILLNFRLQTLFDNLISDLNAAKGNKEKQNKILKDFVTKKDTNGKESIRKIIIPRNCATTHVLDDLASDITATYYEKLKSWGLDSKLVEQFKNCVEVKEVNVGFKFFAQAKHNAEDNGDLFLLGVESSGGISVAEWIYDKCGFLANLMILFVLVEKDKQPEDILSEVYSRVNYEPQVLETAISFREVVEKEGKLNTPEQISEEAKKRQEKLMSVVTQLKENEKLTVIKNMFTDIDKGLVIKEIRDNDGIKILFENGAWLLVRPSGTEPLVRVFVETKNEMELSEALVDFVTEKDGQKLIDTIEKNLGTKVTPFRVNTSLFETIIENSIKALQRLTYSVLFEDITEYTIVANATDFERRTEAKKLSEQGIKVNLVLLGENSLTVETNSRISTDNGELAFCLIDSSNKNLTVYGYDDKTYGQNIDISNIDEQSGLIAMLKYINDNSNKKMKILDLPDNLGKDIVSPDVLDFAKKEFFVVGVGKSILTLLSEALKNKLKTSDNPDASKNKLEPTDDMVLKPSLVATNLSAEQIDSFGQIDIDRLDDQGVTTIIISANDKLIQDKSQTLKDLLQMAHNKGLKVMFNYSFDLKNMAIDDFSNWISSFNDKFQQFNENGGIDGFQADLSQSGTLANNSTVLSLLSALSKIIKEQNVGSFLSIKMPSDIYPTEFLILCNNEDIKLVVDCNSPLLSTGLSNLKNENMIVNIPADKNDAITLEQLSGLFKNNNTVSMVSLDFSILEAIGDDKSFTFNKKQMTIVKFITSIFETTPKGQNIKGINNGRTFVLNRDSVIQEDILNTLYTMYINDNIDINQINAMLRPNFKENISEYELKGFIEGVLQATELKKLNEVDISFDKKDYTDLLMKTLLDYRIDKGISFNKDLSSDIEEILIIANFRAVFHENIKRVFATLNDSGTVDGREDIAIERLSSLLKDNPDSDTPELNSQERAMVLEGILLLLLGYAKQDIIDISAAMNDDNIANIKALLSAA